MNPQLDLVGIPPLPQEQEPEPQESWSGDLMITPEQVADILAANNEE
jgi:hypothetical protein